MPTLVSIYTAGLTKPEEIADGTMAFHLEKDHGFELRTGRSIDLTVIDLYRGHFLLRSEPAANL